MPFAYDDSAGQIAEWFLTLAAQRVGVYNLHMLQGQKANKH